VVPIPRSPRIEAFGISHPGVQRTTNEDAYLVAPDIGLFLVADGMGGAVAGDVASRMAIDTVRAVFEDADLTWPRGLPHRPSDAGLPLLRASVEHANARVHDAAVADQTKEGMGTTLTALLALGDRVALAHVGDSRVYGLRGRRLQQLTNDHTLVNEYVNAGIMSRDDAAVSPIRHVLSRALGTGESVEVDARLVAAEPGDTFLLASDGLHGVVDDTTIAAILLRESDLTLAATRLVERANELGGPDNVTVVLVRWGRVSG
jgi:protein phosphatase